MPQEFQVLKCCECGMFQVQQMKKVKKWSCKMCGVKQSVIKVFGRGNGAECRKHVQKLNMRKGEIEEDTVALEEVAYNQSEYDQTRDSYNEPCEAPSDVDSCKVNKWEKYITPEESDSVIEDNTEDDTEQMYYRNHGNQNKTFATNKASNFGRKKVQNFEKSQGFSRYKDKNYGDRQGRPMEEEMSSQNVFRNKSDFRKMTDSTYYSKNNSQNQSKIYPRKRSYSNEWEDSTDVLPKKQNYLKEFQCQNNEPISHNHYLREDDFNSLSNEHLNISKTQSNMNFSGLNKEMKPHSQGPAVQKIVSKKQTNPSSTGQTSGQSTGQSSGRSKWSQFLEVDNEPIEDEEF